jgi:signal transduction histidine kinase
MNLHRLGLPVLGVTLVAALMFTWLRSRDYDTAAYFENVALLGQIKQLDARWELDAMKSRIGLNQNYDPLVNPLRDMNLLPQHLAPLATPPQPAGSAMLHAAVAAYEQSLNDKAALVEAFKSHNAVLRNSLVFLPTAADDITRMAGPLSGAALQASANRVLLTTLIYHQVPGDEARRDAEAALAILSAQTDPLSPELRERAEILAMHAAAILREHLTVNRLLNQIADVPTAARIDAINNLLGVEQQRTVQQLQTYRSFLSLLAAALVGLLLYAAARLVHSHATINRVNAELHHMNEHLEGRVRERTAELVQANARLQTEMAERKQLESLLVQSEKLASIGQLAAGVAHEINNPLAFLASNFGMLEQYLASLFDMLAAYEQAESGMAPAQAALVNQARERIELDYLKEDMPALVADSLGGLERVGKIVRDLKDFAHVDCEQDWKWADLRIGLASTLNIVASELRQVAEIVTEYAAIPEVECMPSQLNQVFMNLMVNAAQAMGSQRGRITIRTGCAHEEVWIEVSDTGSGIPDHVLPHIFDPFYTTKGIGKGTGLGLSLSYGIVQNHQGRIDVATAAGHGTTFRVTLPVSRKPADAHALKAA